MQLLSGILFSLYRGTPIYNDWVVACLRGQWPKLVGERLACFCRPAAFDKSRLVIEILDDAWLEAIKSVKQEILDKLRIATGGEIRSISLITKRPEPGNS